MLSNKPIFIASAIFILVNTGLFLAIVLSGGSIGINSLQFDKMVWSNKPPELDYSGISLRDVPEYKPEIGYQIPILMYHYVEYNPNEADFLRDSINIEPDVFEQQVKTLKEYLGIETFY